MKKTILILLWGVFSMNAQKYVDLSEELANITHGMVINGNDYSLTEQVIINTTEILGQGKFNLLESSRIYVKSRSANAPTSKLYSAKPFGEEVPLKKCTLFSQIQKGTPYTIWHTNGKKYTSGVVGDGMVVKRMFYNIKIGKKYMDKQLLTD